MIFYYATHGSRQRINKSIQEEYKIWVLVGEAYGCVVQFTPCQSAKKKKKIKENRLPPLQNSLLENFGYI